MRKPVVDYKQFRLSKITSPEYNHLLYLLGWVGYFILYFVTENLITTEYHVIYSPLDDLLFPFCEWFVIPYVFWYFLIAFTLFYMALYNPKSFKRFMVFLMVCQYVGMTIYMIYPNGQNLRPDLTQLGRENPLTQLVGLLYSFDTNTNVCPSMHVAYSIGIASVWLKEKTANVPFKVFIVFCAVLISLSTAFIKQHSIVDAFVALPLCLLAEFVAFGKGYWFPKLKKK